MRRSLLMTEEERRGLSLADAGISIRTSDEGSSTFVGHAAVFDSRTAIGNPLTWGFYEEIAPGSFTKTLSEGDARMLIDHDSYYVCSRVSANTLHLAQDKRGLAVTADLDDELSYVKDLKANLRNGNITGMSFGFYVVKDEWSTEDVELSDGNSAEIEIRRITEIRLIEVSAVTFPAYEETDAGMRALRHRNDPTAIARMAKYRPELAEQLGYIPDIEPAETTRDEDTTESTEYRSDETEATEPAASTQLLVPSIEDRMRALAARFRLPAE